MSRMTQRDLARQLGIDHKTVSRGLVGAPDVSARTSAKIRHAAAEAGFDLPAVWPLTTHETRSPHVRTDDRIAADGKHLGRFTYSGADWLPSATGTHDGYEYRLGFYCLEREGADDGPAE